MEDRKQQIDGIQQDRLRANELMARQRVRERQLAQERAKAGLRARRGDRRLPRDHDDTDDDNDHQRQTRFRP